MNKTVGIIVGVVLIGASFYGGMKYDQSATASARQARVGQFAGGGFGAGRGGRGGANGGGFAMGTILSKDAQSITIQLTNPGGPNATGAGATTGTGSTIVLLSSSTTIMKATTGSASDLTVGQTITVNGTKNSDGSISANSVQVKNSK